MSSFDLDTSFFLDQPQPQKWNGLPDIQKKNIGIGKIREPDTVKTTKTKKKDFKRLCSISSKLILQVFMWLVFYCTRGRMTTYLCYLAPFQVEKDKVHSNVVTEYSVCFLWEYTTLSFLHNVVSTRENTFDYTSKGLT